MMLCCSAKMDSSTRFAAIAAAIGPGVPESMVFGSTPKLMFPMNAMEYRKQARKRA
jgi:hypothetical protein